MSDNRWLLTAGIGAMLLAGCDRSAPSQSQQTAPPAAATTQPAEQASAVIAAPATAPTTQRSEVARSFDVTENNVRRTYYFPHARLHIDKEQKQAVLYTDDPKVAIKPNYTGNSYYMVIPLTDDFLNHLDGYQWHSKAVSSDRQDSTEGIFLEDHYQLQPLDILVVFKGDGPKLQVGINGEFFKYDVNPNQLQRDGSLVTVNGVVDATVEYAK